MEISTHTKARRTGKKNRKFGRGFRKPGHAKYLNEDRRLKNKERRARRSCRGTVRHMPRDFSQLLKIQRAQNSDENWTDPLLESL